MRYILAFPTALALFACAPATADPAPAAARYRIVTLAMNESASFGRLGVSPIALVEDSRCPSDVTCIQAGRFRADVRLALDGSASRHVMTIGTPIEAGDHWAVLAKACPYPRITPPSSRDAYRMTFVIGSGAAGTLDAADFICSD